MCYVLTICIPSGINVVVHFCFANAWYFAVFHPQEKPQQSIQAAYDNCPGYTVLTTGTSCHALLTQQYMQCAELPCIYT